MFRCTVHLLLPDNFVTGRPIATNDDAVTAVCNLLDVSCDAGIIVDWSFATNKDGEIMYPQHYVCDGEYHEGMAFPCDGKIYGVTTLAPAKKQWKVSRNVVTRTTQEIIVEADSEQEAIDKSADPELQDEFSLYNESDPDVISYEAEFAVPFRKSGE